MVDATLDGAISKETADRAVALMDGCDYVKGDAGHVPNLEAPDDFI